jgi:hypothetical protein
MVSTNASVELGFTTQTAGTSVISRAEVHAQTLNLLKAT